MDTRRLAELTDEDAHREALPDVDALCAGLRGQYADLQENDVLEIAAFRVIGL